MKKKKRKSSVMKDLEKMIPLVLGAGLTIMLLKQWLKENMLVALDNRIAKKRRKLKRIRTEMKMNWQTEEMKTEQRICELVSLRRQLMKEFKVVLSKKLKQQKSHTRKRK